MQMTGIVRRNGRDFGWYRIAYNGGDAFVSAKYLTSKQPGGSNSQDALDTAPGSDTQDPYADADAGFAIDTPLGSDTQDPYADADAGYAIDTPLDSDTQDPLAD